MSILRGHAVSVTDSSVAEMLMEKRLRRMSDEIRSLRDENHRLVHKLERAVYELERSRRMPENHIGFFHRR